MGSVYLLTLRQLLGRGRIITMLVLGAMPVLISILIVSESGAMHVKGFEKVVLSAMLAGAITPLIVLAIAAAAFANEIEDRTLANLTLSPIPRWQIVLPKLLGSITVAAPFIAASAFVTSYIAFMGDMQAIVAVTLAALASVVLYASAFTWLGLMSTQAIGIGLLYIVLWEGFISGYVGGARIFSIRYYAVALMQGLDPRRFATLELLSPTAAIVVSLVVFLGFVFLSVRRLRRIDIP